MSAPAAEVQAPIPAGEAATAQEPDVDVLTRGQLHEAFAEVPQRDPRPNPIIRKQPPAPIEELPPEYKPAGQNVQWIPGYWAWEDDRADFIWISGIWRDIPPGQRWVPGYWQTLAEGYRWINGFWIEAAVEQVNYLPVPPESLELGPSTPAPSDDYFYAPGSWVFHTNAYVWRPGCWMPRIDRWVWVPPAYVWTPAGCVFRPAYWDRLFDCRGLAFAPVCFRQPIYQRIGFVYTPSCVIHTNVELLPHLFVRRHCRSYYFGDWYDVRYTGHDFCAWSRIDARPRLDHCYDALFTYYNCRAVRYNDVQVIDWVRERNRDCHEHAEHRPRGTFDDRVDRHDHAHRAEAPRRGAARVELAEDLETHVRKASARSTDQVRFQRLAEGDRKAIQQDADPIWTIARHRERSEKLDGTIHEAPSSGGATSKAAIVNGKLPLPKVDRQQQVAAQRLAAELKRKQEQQEREAELALRRAQRQEKVDAERSSRQLDRAPVLLDSAERMRYRQSTGDDGDSVERGAKDRQAKRQPSPENRDPDVDKSALRRLETERLAADLKLAQQARSLQREQEKAEETRHREVRQRQLSEKLAQQRTGDQVLEQQLSANNELKRQLREQETRQRQLETQQRRQQNASELAARQQQVELQQQQRRAQEEASRQLRDQQRQQQREERRKKDD